MPHPVPFAMPRTPVALFTLAVLTLVLATGAPASAGIFPGDPVVGPAPPVQRLDGLDLAPDGTGAIVFTRLDGGVAHLFVSRLVNGAWSAAERLDAGLGAATTQAAVAAGDDGRVIVAFANGGNVYAVNRAASSAGWVRQTLWSGGGASDPAVDLSVNGKGYAIFAAPGAGGHDVRAAYSKDAGSWSVIGAPLDAVPANDAGAGAGRAHVAASADGVGIVVWGEAGHVIARRVLRTSPSVVAVDALGGLVVEGVQASAADAPVVSTQDDDSFTGVAFRATFDLGGGVTRQRAIFRRLRGSRFESPHAVDAAPFSSGQGSLEPRIATVGTGQGLVVAGNDTTHLTTAMQLLFDIGPGPAAQVDSQLQSTAATHAVPAAATARKMAVAWELTPSGGMPAIHGRYRDGGDFEAELALSRPELGATVAAAGLFAAGDDAGDIAVAFAQDVPGQGRAISVATVDQPPGRFSAKPIPDFQRTTRPVLTWTISRETWGRYFRVAIDGVQVGLTGRRSFRPPTALAQGAHTWQVTALDRRGQQFVAPATTVKVDTVAPFVNPRVSGARRAGSTLRLAVKALDTPTGTAVKTPGVVTSGIASIVVDWGDRTPRETIRRGAQHAYARAGRYFLRVTVTDRAGNRRTVKQVLKVAKPAKHAKRASSAR